MAITSSSRAFQRVSIGEEARRSGNLRIPAFQARNGEQYSVFSTSTTSQKQPQQRNDGVLAYKQHAFWFLKQLSPGLMIIIFYFTLRSIDRRTQLKAMMYAQEAVMHKDNNGDLPSKVSNPLTNRITPQVRLGARVPLSLSDLADLSTQYNPKTDTPYFWDIHFAGESIAESVLTKCHFLILACENGIQQPMFNKDKLEVFETTHGALHVNVDTTTAQGIRRAKELGLADSRLAEVMTSPQLHLFVSNIFNRSQKGRMFSLFRHPIDRAVSMYYYLSSAIWDPLYDPQLRHMTLEEYAQSGSVEHNWMTRFLVDKQGGKLTNHDMLVAKEILRMKCLIGIYEDLESSLLRFQIYFGWSPNSPPDQVKSCRTAVLQAGDPRNNIPELDPSSTAYMALTHVNKYDLELYAYARKLYDIQGEQIFGIGKPPK
jgi:hypothetical protein